VPEQSKPSKSKSTPQKKRKTAKTKPTTGRSLAFADVLAIGRVSQPAVSPDGQKVAYVRRDFVAGEDRFRASVRLVDLESGEDRELTPGPGNHHSPAFSPDGQTLAIVSKRDDHGPQLWLLPLAGGEARRLTRGIGGVQSPLWSPDGKRLAFARDVIVSVDYKPKKAKAADGDADKPEEAPKTGEVFGVINTKSSAKVSDSLLFRHWDAWRDRRRKHVFIVDAQSGQLRDLTPGDWDAPPISLGSDRDFDFSPDGKELAFVANPDEVVARSTNNCIFVQRLSGLTAKGAPLCVSISEACDCRPRYSADGRYLFYLAMQKPGYEADRNRLNVYDRKSGETTVHLQRFDRNPATFELAPPNDEGRTAAILFSADDLGYHSVYRLDLARGRVRQLTRKTKNGALRVLADGRLIVTRQSTTTPADLFLLEPAETGITPQLKNGADDPEKSPLPVDAGCRATPLTQTRSVLADVEMNDAEELWYPGADQTPVHGFLIKPPGFTARKRYPLILLIHGGPQGAFGDDFHYRWNAQLFASRGACVALLNPRGSTGYGQRFKEQISGDWTGRVYEDLMRGVDYLSSEYRFIDGKRVAAAGASFGGFMVNWMLGHTNRFRAFVSHDGVFNAETMAYTTEELWFDEHEHGPLPIKGDGYRKGSPICSSKTSRRRRSSCRASKTFVVRFRKGSACSRPCRSWAFPRVICTFPTKATGSSVPQTARSGTTRCWAG
jgi:dipeptidyl aminopeptidase/acylaminoacyl peptidase